MPGPLGDLMSVRRFFMARSIAGARSFDHLPKPPAGGYGDLLEDTKV
jgi:hypothetical protein